MRVKNMLKYIILIIFILICGCATSRDSSYRQIREAQAVIYEARKIDAPVYAPETYLEAQLKLRKAKRMMSTENFSTAKSLAQNAADIGEQALEESEEERFRVKAQVERLLYNGGEIWSRYENGAEKKYVPQALIEIKRLLDDGRSKLNNGHYMQALDSVQKSHQRLAEIPELMEKGKVLLLEEEKNRAVSKLKAAEILDLATKEAAKIKLEAGKEAEMIIRESQVKAASLRMKEFERIYPVTYKVKKGETLVDIAQRREIFNDKYMWPLIYKANRDQMRDPQVVFPGQILSIPRDLSFEEIIEARKQAKAPPPYTPSSNAYNPEFYRRHIMLVPQYKDVSKDKGTEIPVEN
jgi:LysM repeat protein